MELTPEAQELFDCAKREILRANFNPAAVLKTAERIAEMDKADSIRPEHIAEAVQYRGDVFDYLKGFIMEDLISNIDATAGRIEQLENGASLDRMNDVYQMDVKGQIKEIMDYFFQFYHIDYAFPELKRLLKKIQKKFITEKMAKTYKN